MLEERLSVDVPRSVEPILLVVVDTEEEFDWGAEFDRNATDISAVRFLWRLQEIFDRFGICPTYVVDYAIASQTEGVEALAPYISSGRATVGAHLQAWINPPFGEEMSRYYSYQANLPDDLERKKLGVLKGCIRDSFGVDPLVHKAGRYGIGAGTPKILQTLGFEIDMSTVPAFDFSDEGGPDFSSFGAEPFWFSEERRLLGIPNTGGFIGALSSHGPRVFSASALGHPVGAVLSRALSKTRTLERILLSPEGHSLTKLMRLTRALHAGGFRVFTLSLHSSTVKPGGTPYAPDIHAVARFLDRTEEYFEFFFGELNGCTMTPVELKSRIIDGF